MTVLLGVNIDHVATVRQARGTIYPSVIEAAEYAERGGAHSITVHLREDRRHIQDSDVAVLCKRCATPINLEIAVTAEMLDFALTHNPSDVCLVPEKRVELTTEGGLDVLAHQPEVAEATRILSAAGIRVSLFIDPNIEQISAAHAAGAPVVELHTGTYADCNGAAKEAELERIHIAALHAHKLGLQVNAGHGLHYTNVQPIVRIPHMVELNIGHAIVARSIFTGLEAAVREMRQLIHSA
ncbi:MAG: pyridoxine 5'-phosphate synthase [Xanthomonadales bacterium]|nr:pyridoxine 5'-phosphate synthase [Xanthomonadales bacterium]